MGHIAKNCLLLPVPQKPSPPPQPTKKNPNSSNKTYVPKQPAKTTLQTILTPSPIPPSNLTSSSPTFTPLPVTNQNNLPPSGPEKAPSTLTVITSYLSTFTPSVNPQPLPNFNIETSPPNPRLRLSLKRSRSDPTLSPPHSSLLPPPPTLANSTSTRTPILPLLLTLPAVPLNTNPFFILAIDSSLSQGESPSLF